VGREATAREYARNAKGLREGPWRQRSRCGGGDLDRVTCVCDRKRLRTLQQQQKGFESGSWSSDVSRKGWRIIIDTLHSPTYILFVTIIIIIILLSRRGVFYTYTRDTEWFG